MNTGLYGIPPGLVVPGAIPRIPLQQDGAGGILWCASKAPVAYVTLTANGTLLMQQHDLVVGTYILEVFQDSTGSRTMTWPSWWKWSGGAAPVISTAANAWDVLSLSYNGTNMTGGLYIRGGA